jgi:hypothetical protein
MSFNFYILSSHACYFEDYVLSITNKFKLLNEYYKIIYYNINEELIFKKEDIHIFLQTFHQCIFKDIHNNTFTLKNVINEYNIYIFNTEQLKIRNQHILNYSNNINYIEWSDCNISYYTNCLKSKVFVIPYQVNFNEILNKTKVNDVCMITKRQSEYRLEIFNECKKIIPNITSIVGFGNIRDELLFNHKILINASLEPNCSILEQFRVNRCIYNRIIIISDKKDDRENDFILNKYIIYVENYKDIPNTVKNVLDNYKLFYDKIYGNFDFEIEKIDNLFMKYLKKFIEKNK